MKQGTSALVAAAIFVGCVGVAAAQVPMEGSTVIYGSQAHYYGGRAAPPPGPAPLDGALPSYEVAAILRSGGYLPLGGPIRRGNFYVVAASHQSGDEGRVVIDCYTGRIIRFIPASDVTRTSRGGDDMVLVYQGPTFPPPDGVRPLPPPPPAVAARPVGPLFPAVRGAPPRPPASVPNVASRTPSGPVTPKPRPQVAPAKPDAAQAPPVPAPVETKPAAASPPLVPKPQVEKAPPVQPTKPLPPVQTME